MGLAEDIAGKVKPKGATPKTEIDDKSGSNEIALKPGDRGRAILAAIKHGDGEALETLLERD